MKMLYTATFILILLAFSTPGFAEGGLIEDKRGGKGLAEGEGDANFQFPDPLFIGSPPTRMMEPIQKFLSGSSWMITTNQGRTLLEQHLFIAPSDSPQILQAPGAALVPFREPTPAFSRNILASRDFGRIPFQTEPHLAINPLDPDHLILGVIDYNFPSVNSYVSIDGGETWDGPYQTRYLKNDRGSGGDPIVGFDREGNAYFGYISIGFEEYRVGPFIGASYVSSIAIARSEDGGITWDDPISSSRSLVTLTGQFNEEGFFEGQLKESFLDKPWMAIGPSSSNPEEDVIYVTYTKFETIFDIDYLDVLPILLNPQVLSSIELVRSFDGGRTWTEPLQVSPLVKRTFGGAEGNRVVQGSQPAVAPDGTVYVAWLDSTNDDSFEGLAEIRVARSNDDGRTFDVNKMAALIQEPGFRARTTNFRSWGAAFPQITTGPNGEVYVVYTEKPADKPSDDGDIYFIKSLDMGESWSRQMRLNDDDTNRFQFFPAMDAGPDGTLHVMWGDMRDDPHEAAYHIYYTRSNDGGETWGFELEEINLRFSSARVTDFPSNPNFGFPRGQFIGDYFSLKATEDDAYLVWADTRLGEFGALNQKIGFARQKAMRSPAIFISPPSGSGGAEITVVGFNFQPAQTFSIQLEDEIISGGRTDGDGGFTVKLFVPVSSEGTHNIFAFDESGNFATAAFFTEFGFDTVRKHIDATSLTLTDKLSDLKGDIAELSPDKLTTISGIDLDELVGRLNQGVQETLDNRIVGTGGVPDTKVSDIIMIMWATIAIAIVAVTLAASSIVLQRRKT